VTIKSLRKDSHSTGPLLADATSMLMDHVNKAVTTNRGVMEMTLPGMILATWNAVHSRNGSHQVAACRTAHQVMEWFGSEPLLKDNFELAMAISSGQMRCGAVGTMDTRKFVVIGNTINDCQKLLWLTDVLDGVNVVVDETVQDEASFEFRFLIVDRVQTRKDGPQMIVSELREKSKAGADEWMYELRDAQAKDANRVYNTAFKAFLEGDDEMTKNCVKTLQDDLNGSVLQKLIEKEGKRGGAKYCRTLFGE